MTVFPVGNAPYNMYYGYLLCRDEYEGHLEYDLGNLMAFDVQSIDSNTFSKGLETTCHSLATSIFQSIARQIFSLPSQPATVGRMVELPTPTTLLPREKPLPKPRPPTKWEIFAQRKGIQKRKRSKLEWDENAQEWRRRYGYKRVNDESDIPVIEAKHDEVTGVEDPFTRMKKEKKERIKKQEARQLGNLKAAAKAGGRGVLPATLRLAANLPEHGRGKPTKRKELLSELKSASKHVAQSTASMGKFDKQVAGEKMSDRQNGGVRKRKFLDVTATKTERASQTKVVDHILRKNADDIVDIGRAIGKFEASAREEKRRMKMKGENKKGRMEKGKKGKK